MTSTCTGTFFIVAFATVTGTRNSIGAASGFADLDAQPPSISRPASIAPRQHAGALWYWVWRLLAVMMARTSISSFSWLKPPPVYQYCLHIIYIRQTRGDRNS